MGGYGSGGWNRTGRNTTADVLRLDVNRLNKGGALRMGFSSTLGWDSQKDFETVHIIARVDRLMVTSAGFTDQVHIDWEPCRFGRRRPYFCCPGCGRRTLHLYRKGHFRCRDCQCLSYSSQRERESDRAQRRANKIRVRLGGEPGWHNRPRRPKGMHWSTYIRLLGEVLRADTITDERARKLFTSG